MTPERSEERQLSANTGNVNNYLNDIDTETYWCPCQAALYLIISISAARTILRMKYDTVTCSQHFNISTFPEVLRAYKHLPLVAIVHACTYVQVGASLRNSTDDNAFVSCTRTWICSQINLLLQIDSLQKYPFIVVMNHGLVRIHLTDTKRLMTNTVIA